MDHNWFDPPAILSEEPTDPMLAHFIVIVVDPEDTTATRGKP